MTKTCPMCGKTFEGHQRKYCSFQCSWKAKQEKSQRKTKPKDRKETLCWSCQNACGGCSWSKSFTPVEGWEAKPTKHNRIDSFFVTKCPEYIQDEDRKEDKKNESN